MSYTNNWTRAIRQTLRESHSKEELEKLSVSELKKLHDEYSDKKDDASQKEAKMIEDILDSRSEKEEVNESKIKENIKKTVRGLVEKGKRIATRVGETLIDKQKSDHLSGDIKP